MTNQEEEYELNYIKIDSKKEIRLLGNEDYEIEINNFLSSALVFEQEQIGKKLEKGIKSKFPDSTDLLKIDFDYIKEFHKSINSDRSSSKSMIGVQNNSIYSIISNAQAKLKSTNMNAKKYKLLNKQQTSDRDKDDYDTLWVEDKDTSLDTKSVRNEEKVFKNRFNNIEKKIMNHLYQPSLEKTVYLRRLNLEMKNIKNLTLSNSKYNFFHTSPQKK